MMLCILIWLKSYTTVNSVERYLCWLLMWSNVLTGPLTYKQVIFSAMWIKRNVWYTFLVSSNDDICCWSRHNGLCWYATAVGVIWVEEVHDEKGVHPTLLEIHHPSSHNFSDSNVVGLDNSIPILRSWRLPCQPDTSGADGDHLYICWCARGYWMQTNISVQQLILCQYKFSQQRFIMFKEYISGASMSKPHTSELNYQFSAYIFTYTYMYNYNLSRVILLVFAYFNMIAVGCMWTVRFHTTWLFMQPTGFYIII